MPRVTRRQALSKLTFVPAAAWGTAASLRAETSGQQPTAAELITPETQRAIDAGLVFLARRQIRNGRERGGFGTSGYPGGVAVCSLAGLAFMCGGNTPEDGPYHEHVTRCVDFILRNTQHSGFIAVAGGQDRMYGHGFATLFLSQAYGMTRRQDVGEKLRAAVDLIVRCQNDAGGWRYQPVKSDADLSITICQIMALRAARDAGIFVPKETRTRCIDYVKQSQNADGGFRYTIRGGHSTFPLTAAGVVSLYSAGIYSGPAIEKGLEKLIQQMPGSNASPGGSYFFYGHYYAMQAMWHAGGKYWRTWYPNMRDLLLNNQQSDGSWIDAQIGPEFGTAMAAIMLLMPNNYLPIFER